MSDHIDKLLQLKELYEKGIITQEEMEKEKARILNDSAEPARKPGTKPETGQTASLADLVGAENLPRVAELLVDSLKNANGELWKDSRKDSKIDPISLLEQRDGCALIREGLIIYYHPDTIGIGAEGSFSAIIPLDKIPFW